MPVDGRGSLYIMCLSGRRRLGRRIGNMSLSQSQLQKAKQAIEFLSSLPGNSSSSQSSQLVSHSQSSGTDNDTRSGK